MKHEYLVVRDTNEDDVRHFGYDGLPMLVISTYAPALDDVVNGWVFDLPNVRNSYYDFNAHIAEQIRWLRSEYKLSDSHKFHVGYTPHCSKPFVKLVKRWLANHKHSPFLHRKPTQPVAHLLY